MTVLKITTFDIVSYSGFRSSNLKLAMSIYLSHIHCKGVSLHFSEDVFLTFASIVEKGSSKLMGENLAKLIGEKSSEGE